MKFYIILVSAFLMIPAGCKNENTQTLEKPDNTDKADIVLSLEQAQKVGLKLDTIKKATFSKRVNVNGYLETPPQNKANVSANINGRVLAVNYLPGDYVKKGSEVVKLESVAFLELQQKYLELKSTLLYLEDEYNRQKSLSEKKVTAEKVFLKAESDLLNTKAGFNSVSRQLKILHANMVSIERGEFTEMVSVKAPINGYISEINAVISEFVHTEDEIFRMVNPEHLHAELNVFEKDALKIKKGQEVEIRIPQMDGKITLGEVFLVGKEIDDETRSVNVHVHIHEEEGLMVGLYIEGEILIEEIEAFGIPIDGLIKEEGGNYIYALKDKNEKQYFFERHWVNTGLENEGIIEIVNPPDILKNSLVAIDGIYYLSTMGGGK